MSPQKIEKQQPERWEERLVSVVGPELPPKQKEVSAASQEEEGACIVTVGKGSVNLCSKIVWQDGAVLSLVILSLPWKQCALLC